MQSRGREELGRLFRYVLSRAPYRNVRKVYALSRKKGQIMPTESIKYFDSISENRAIADEQGSYNWIYGKIGCCPHCDSVTKEVFATDFSKYFDDDPEYHDPCLDEHYNLRVWNCPCGWWDILRDGNSGHDSIDPPYSLYPIWRHGILKLFDVSDQNLPIPVLRTELQKKGELLHHIHPDVMEDLVAGVFSDFFGKCSATVCGRSGDGGVDVIIVEKNKPVAIQVKRRVNPTKAEPVNLIREFIAALQLGDFTTGYYVTTSDRFSSSATDTAKLAVKKGLVESIELINKQRFLGFLNETNSSMELPWKRFVDELME